ncbi:hypothetical protein ENSA5_40320 [Enhygromyxa salina]|uniref:RNA polymerase sigma factor n=1 Tax=Enhygromyxa salina TaxID=215803 RepID=A0A2S9XQ92_9BACT|nr:sigma-70 family RNA polymerase sigma factor [Enhygromyxa salina]PRP95034.1 hypothetical protein ENSA5_40320 [Enhygromyxa salina]
MTHALTGIFLAMLLDHRKFLAGDPRAGRLFLKTTRRWVQRFFANTAQIDSVVQAAITEMLDRLRAGEDPEADRTLQWIRACANNAVRRELTRTRNATSEMFESHLHGQASVDMSRTLRLREELEGVEDLLEGCDPRARQILQDRVRGVAYREIARNYELGEGAARESVARLRRRLAGELTRRDKAEQLLRKAKRFKLARHSPTLPGDPTDC